MSSCIVCIAIVSTHMVDISVYHFCIMKRRPPGSTQSRSSAASDVYNRQVSMCAYYVYLFIHNAKKKLKILKHHLTQLVNKAAPWKKAGYRLVA